MSDWPQTRIPQRLFQTVLLEIFPWQQVRLPVVEKRQFISMLLLYLSLLFAVNKQRILPYKTNVGF